MDQAHKAMRLRLRFWWSAMRAGAQWAWGVLDGGARVVTVVVLLAAIALPSFLTKRPAWESLVVAGVLLLIVFAEGSYRAWRTVDEQLATRTDGQSRGEPVSDDHRKELQAIAERLLEGVHRGEVASFLAEDTRINMGIAFTEHFPDVSQSVVNWAALIQARDEARQALSNWIAKQFLDAGITGAAPGVPGYIAREAESDDPQLTVDEATSEVRVGTKGVLVFSLAPAPDREKKIAALRELFGRIRAQPEYSRISKAHAEMKSIQVPLIEKLELIRDKTVIRGHCKLCE